MFGALTKIRDRIKKLENEACTSCCMRCVSMIDSLARRLAEVEQEIVKIKRQQDDSMANRP